MTDEKMRNGVCVRLWDLRWTLFCFLRAIAASFVYRERGLPQPRAFEVGEHSQADITSDIRRRSNKASCVASAVEAWRHVST
jgi:hypothetical protein